MKKLRVVVGDEAQSSSEGGEVEKVGGGHKAKIDKVRLSNSAVMEPVGAGKHEMR